MVKPLDFQQDFPLLSDDLITFEDELRSNPTIIINSLEEILIDNNDNEETNMPKYESELDLLVPKIGKTKEEELAIRKHLFELAKSTNATHARKAKELLKKYYNLVIIQ